MDSRERVITALNHREPDRVPFDLGATGVTGIERQAVPVPANGLGSLARRGAHIRRNAAARGL